MKATPAYTQRPSAVLGGKDFPASPASPWSGPMLLVKLSDYHLVSNVNLLTDREYM